MAQPQPPSLSEELARVSGDQVTDLRALSQASWFVFNPAAVNTAAVSADSIGYVAFGRQYFGVSVDWDAVHRWESTAEEIDAIAPGLLTGVRGAEDVRTLDALFDAVTTLTNYLTATTPLFENWVESAGTPDAGLGGGAVDLIVSTLDHHATNLEDWRASLRTASGAPLASAVDNARVLLRRFDSDVAGSWADVQAQGLRGKTREGIESAIASVRAHLVSGGIVLGTPGYLFDDWDPATGAAGPVTPAELDAFRARVEAQIRATLASYPAGNLQDPGTWAAINQAITASVTPLIDQVSEVARERREALEPAYTDLATGLAPASALGASGRGAGDASAPELESGAGNPGDANGVGGAPDPDPAGGQAGSLPVDAGGALGSDALGGGAVGGGAFGSDALGSALGGGAVGSGGLGDALGGGGGAFGGGALDSGPVSLGATMPGGGTVAGEPGGEAVPAVGLSSPSLVLPMLAGGRLGRANRRDDPDVAGVVPVPGAAGAPAPLAANAAPPGGSAGPVLATGTAGPAGGGLTNPALALSDENLPAWDGRVGGDGRAGLPRSAEQILLSASPASAYQTPGFWPPGMYGPSATQFAGSPAPYGSAPRGPGWAPNGSVGGFAGYGDRRFSGLHQPPSRLTDRYGPGAGPEHPYRWAGARPPHAESRVGQGRRGHDDDGAEQESGRGRVVPGGGDESWSPAPSASQPVGLIAPTDDDETPDTFASVAALATPMLVGAARRRDDDDDEYRDEPRRGLADGVIDGGE